MTRSALILRVDRRVLKRLYEAGEIAGVFQGGVIWLERKSLAAYLWARPRCVREGCGRRVIGDGPGCNQHRRDGRRRGTGRTHPARPPATGRCEWCGKPSRGRFCQPACSVAWLNEGPGADDRHDQLQDGHRRYRAEVDRVKAERNLLDVDELAKRLSSAGVPRSPAAISGHIHAGLLKPETGLGFKKPQLFTKTSVDELIKQLRNHQDGRLLRFDGQPFRGIWHQARHGSTAGHGLLNAELGRRNVELAAARGKKAGRPRELDAGAVARIGDMASRGKSQRAIAQAMGISRGQVRRVLTS